MQRYYRYLPIGLTLSLGVGLSLIASILVGKWERSSRHVQFQRRIDNLTTALQRSINRYTEVLLATGDFYDASQLGVNRQEFKTFVRRAITSYRGIQALEWAPHIRDRERLSYEQTMRSQGYPTFQITEKDNQGTLIRAKQRQDYFPVTYVEPWEGNEVAFGYNLSSDITRRAALERARDTAKIATTDRITLVQEEKDQFGFLVVLPVYRHQTSVRTLQARRENLEGVVLGVFRVSDVVEESLQELNFDIDFYINDLSASSEQHFLGVYESTTKSVSTFQPNHVDSRIRSGTLCFSATVCTRNLTVGERQWSILFLPAATYTQNERSWGALATLAIGLLLTSILVLYLSRSRAELERTREISELKLRFFSMASHEFRTPLSTILISSQSLEANIYESSEEQKIKTIQRIQAAAKRMTQLLNDSLTITRAEAGKLEFAPELMNLEQFCRQLIEEVQFDSNGKHQITFTSHNADTKAFLDKKLLRSLLTNLLSNAIKYSPPDSEIDFTLHCDAKEARFQICDRGIGIPPEDRERLFETFHRGSNVGDITGTGLGLAVVKTCVDLHGGQIAVESEMGVGTRFTVILPQEETRVRE